MAIQDEQDQRNLHLLLQSLHVIIKDIATYECVSSSSTEQHSDSRPVPGDANPNLISEDEGLCVYLCICLSVWVGFVCMCQCLCVHVCHISTGVCVCM